MSSQALSRNSSIDGFTLSQFGYRACKRTRVRRRHEEIEDRLAVYQSQVSTNFTLKGAAIRIQRAWRRSHWRLRKLVAKLKIRRQQAAVTLQVRVSQAKQPIYPGLIVLMDTTH